MAMYYYASKLNEASCSNNRCTKRVPPAPSEPASCAPSTSKEAPILADPALLNTGNGLSYYDNDDYYSMVRGNKFVSQSACQHILMNGAINFMTTQKVDAPQIQTVITPRGMYNYGDKPDVELRDGQVIVATFEALMDMLRPGANKSFKFTFFLCFRLCVRPHELLAKLCKKHFRNYDRIKEKGPVKVELLHSERDDMASLVALFTDWTAMFPYDFRDDRVMALVRIISERCSAEHMEEVRVEMSTTLEKLLNMLTALERYEKTLLDVPQMSSVEHLAQGDILTLGLTPIALASQLTMVEHYRMSFVGPEEFVQTFAPHPASPSLLTTSTSIKLHHMDSKCTRNLEAYADWFNRLSYLVATDILKSMKGKYRARVIEQWVMTARECFNLGNFNSLMAIIGALNMAPVSRLKKTWNRASPVYVQQLRQLELCVEPSGNHARYRAALAAAPTETSVPLLSVTCRDLHFANQAAPTRLTGTRVNFEKWSVLAKFVDGQLAGRRLMGVEGGPTPPAQHNHAVWRFLNDRPTLTDTAMEMISFDHEPPSDNLERDRFKRLRLDS